MRRQNRNQRTACWWLILFSSASLVACGGGNGDASDVESGPEPVTIFVSVDTATVQPGGTAQLTATVNNDAAHRGVTWTISCPAAPCGTVSPATTASGSATTYTAPAAQPVGDLVVTVTATSESDVAATASTLVTVTAMQVSIATDSLEVNAGASAAFTATVINDSTNQGVNWALACNTAPCGEISPATTPSGAATTYTAPSTHPLGDLEVTITATSVGNPAASASIVVTVPGVRVSITPDFASVPAGATAEFTATVVNDPDDNGVTWTVTCGGDPASCGTVSQTASPSGVAVVYTAPSTPPPDDLTVSLVATSVTLPTSSGVATIDLSAIAASVAPRNALIPLNATEEFTAVVSNDPADAGVSWTLVHEGVLCPADCGTASPATTESGSATIYTAPGAVLAPSADVYLTATSITDESKTAASAIRITAGTVKLVPRTLRFSRHGALSAKLTNTGTSVLMISSIALAGTNASVFTETDDCGSSLDAGSFCTIKVNLRATARAGNAVVLINDSSIDSPQRLELTALVLKRGASAAMRDALAHEETATVPPPTGSSKVGTRVMHFADPKREDPYLMNGTKRELMVRFWYPAAADVACTRAEYISPGVRAYISELLGLGLPQVTTNSCLDATAAPDEHPVVVFTHGFSGTFTDYTFLSEDLASRGYVVASVDHTFEATAVEFPDGRIEKSRYGSYLTKYVRSDPNTLDYAASVRLDDLRFVINELQRLNARPDSAFAARLDLSRIALAGHSLGGLTTILGVEREARVKAGVVLDGLMPVTHVNRTTTPLLMVAAGREQWDDDECRLWDELQGPRAAVNLKGVEHFAFSDAVWLTGAATETGTAGPDKTVAAIRDYVAAFLDANLRSKPVSPLLTKASLRYPEVALTTPKEALCRAR
jgi:predicted dienelactone hydrolase